MILFIKMTKLLEWLLFATLFFSIWITAITESINLSFIIELRGIILVLPFIVLLLFGLYSAIVILYRVFTFNNCESAAVELQEEIEEAKRDLQSKGVVLKSK
ncbi:dolichol-phosphate mannosyltransferase subunit 3-like [Ceratina calcarata]|uniref:Dolichol-phosphate mannosyltransferase subunit 3 n=2 Tax=Ceratina calcarata TaxID=156304 RepID=A0AAJ7IX48_9HYME|nr:dolichol-phosphate mannosyltransferase subunit 3-like [Ceratina calcarata]